MPPLEQLIRLGCAVVGGAALGLNRKVQGKAAGMRTHALVSLGAALAVLAAELLVADTPDADRAAVTRTMQGVISGIGFLGAGAILKGGDRSLVRGLTTAASIWMAAAIGIASGGGYWRTALLATALALVVLVGGRPVERWVNRALHHDTDDERRLMRDRRDEPAPPPDNDQ
jgi:putative Mg2+ transporter-C (MgtC) family protein